MSATYWPEEGRPSFVSDTGEVGTWRPLCDLHDGRVEMTYRFTTMSNYICPECGTMHLIWAEDWPDAYEDACDECDAWPADVLTNGGENRNAPGTWHEDSCSLHTDNIEG